MTPSPCLAIKKNNPLKLFGVRRGRGRLAQLLPEEGSVMPGRRKHTSLLPSLLPHQEGPSARKEDEDGR